MPKDILPKKKKLYHSLDELKKIVQQSHEKLLSLANKSLESDSLRYDFLSRIAIPAINNYPAIHLYIKTLSKIINGNQNPAFKEEANKIVKLLEENAEKMNGTHFHFTKLELATFEMLDRIMAHVKDFEEISPEVYNACKTENSLLNYLNVYVGFLTALKNHTTSLIPSKSTHEKKHFLDAWYSFILDLINKGVDPLNRDAAFQSACNIFLVEMSTDFPKIINDPKFVAACEILQIKIPENASTSSPSDVTQKPQSTSITNNAFSITKNLHDTVSYTKKTQPKGDEDPTELKKQKMG